MNELNMDRLHDWARGIIDLTGDEARAVVAEVRRVRVIEAGLTEERCCDHARRELREHGGTRYVMCGEYGGGETCRTRYVTQWKAGS